MGNLPNWLEKDKSVRKKSDKKTKKFAKKINAKVVSNSGAPWNVNGDLVIGKNIILERKDTDKKQFILKENMLKKIFRDAVKNEGKEPFFMVVFKKYKIIGKVFKNEI